ncbi:restriction endonuclease [Neobacillus drentensis]|uniref:restriction endonuclease n=1 Tax=Neobacillus drentensis TaxID=220684 RepID=UPI00285A9551|nr:restriction endonuclease [Neobacillus drentensis]MDR7240476.1 restriction system protein [Neobacillus drentensis]
MSKRKTKKQQRQLEEGIKLILLLVGGAAWYLTQTLYATLWIVGAVMVLMIVLVVLQNNKQKERLRKSGINDIDSMDGIRFEYYLKELYLSRGYGAEVTNASGDYGADLLLNKDGKKIVVQAKRYSKDVGIKAVQEVIGAKSYYKADEAWVVSNRYFTKAAKDLAQKGNVLLVDRDTLIDYILVLNPVSERPEPSNLTTTVPSSTYGTCSKCGSPMVLRTGKRGEFLGCSSFPKCRHTEDLSI